MTHEQCSLTTNLELAAFYCHSVTTTRTNSPWARGGGSVPLRGTKPNMDFLKALSPLSIFIHDGPFGMVAHTEKWDQLDFAMSYIQKNHQNKKKKLKILPKLYMTTNWPRNHCKQRPFYWYFEKKVNSSKFHHQVGSYLQGLLWSPKRKALIWQSLPMEDPRDEHRRRAI